MTYEYEREDGTHFDATQSMKDEPLTECPITGQKCKKVIPKRRTPFGFQGSSRGTKYTEWF